MPKLSDIRVVLWDVYGTLIRAERGDLDSLVRRERELRAAFEKTVANFRLRLTAARLHDLFLRGLAAERDRYLAQGVAHPEVRIDEIWFKLLEKIAPQEPTLNYAREVALFFERQANPKTLMPGAYDTLVELQQRGLRQGIISNAQFYTPIELSELLREASAGRIASYESVFDPALVFFSYQLGVSKPDLTAFRKVLDHLHPAAIKARQCLMVGDSQANDIDTARRLGLQALWFAPAGDLSRLADLPERL
jgi:putative hydrolase of the HAD superfamily